MINTFWGSKKSFAFWGLMLLMSVRALFGQAISLPTLEQKIDSLLKTQNIRPFNGVVLIAQNGILLYQNEHGFADFEQQIPLKSKNNFVIGSISKQMTAVLVLRELDQGNVSLQTPIRAYLPNLKPNWADTVTIHHLLNHTSGIVDIDSPLAFRAGTQFSYSNLGYKLLGEIVEKTSGKSLEKLVNELFKLCKMTNSFYPNESKQKLALKAYSRQQDKSMMLEKATFENNYIAAGLFISTPLDLLKWNDFLHGGQLLKPESYAKMTTPSSTREHQLWGKVGYGYGLQIQKRGHLLEMGHSGYVAGFVSNNFYYPESKTSVITLENIDWKDEKAFYFEGEIVKLVRNYFGVKEAKNEFKH